LEGAVECLSHTGGEYFLHRDEERGWVCSCPTPEEKRQDGCKHEVVFRAVCQAAQMQRQLAKPAPAPKPEVDLEEIERQDALELGAAKAALDAAEATGDPAAIADAARALKYAINRAYYTQMARDLCRQAVA
jgi:hypothetical protein